MRPIFRLLNDNSLVVWDMESGNAICGTPAANDAAKCVRFFNGDRNRLVTGGEKHVKTWSLDLENKKIRGTACQLGKLIRRTTNLAIASDDSFVYCGTDTGDLLEVRLENGLYQRSGKNKVNFSLGITCSAVLPDGDLIIGTGAGELVKFHKAANGRVVH